MRSWMSCGDEEHRQPCRADVRAAGRRPMRSSKAVRAPVQRFHRAQVAL